MEGNQEDNGGEEEINIKNVDLVKIKRMYRIIESIKFQNTLMYSKMNFLILSQSFFITASFFAFYYIKHSLGLFIAITSMIIVILFGLNILRTRGYLNSYDNRLIRLRKGLNDDEKKYFIDLPIPRENNQIKEEFKGLRRFGANSLNICIMWTFIFMWVGIIIVEWLHY